jgi:chromosome partitioning protein
MEKTGRMNFRDALSAEGNNLCDYAVDTKTPGVSLIASSPYLADLRTINEKRLARMIPTLYGHYDVFLIDCHPTYDNIVLNALHAADYVITPVLKDLFSYNAAVFLSEKLPQDVEGLRNWFILLNGYDKRFDESKTGRQSDFLRLYGEKELPLTPKETWLPWTAQIHLAVDYGKKLSCERRADSVYNPALYGAVKELSGCFFDETPRIPEAF